MTDVCVIGRGFAGLTTALELCRNGLSVNVVGPQVKGFDASRAAHGLSTIKGLLESSQALFALKMLGHDEFPGYINALEVATERIVPKILTGVWEPFWTTESLKNQRKRTFKGRFTGCFNVKDYYAINDFKSLFSGVFNDAFAWCHYPGDFWIETDSYLSCLEEACRRAGAQFSCDNDIRSVRREKSLWCCESAQGEKIWTKCVVICAGVGSAGFDISESLSSELKGASGWTFRLPNLAETKRELAVVKETSALALFENMFFVGSTTDANDMPLCDKGVPRSFAEPSQTSAESALEDLVQKIGPKVFKGANFVQATGRWGVRVRTRDRAPLVGRIPNSKEIKDLEGLYINTGYYKSGLTLAPLGARHLANMILDRPTDPRMKIFDPMRLLRDKA